MAEQAAGLELATVMKESLGMHGALGAVAYTVLKGMQAAGADDKILASVRVLLQEHFQRLSDPDCNVLCDVLYARLQSMAESGPWYG
jgi:hypothetical protein